MTRHIDAKQLSAGRRESPKWRLLPKVCLWAVGVVWAAAGARVAVCQLAPPHTDGTFHNATLKLCLQPVNGSTAAGAAIVQLPCDGSVAQKWWNVSVPKGRLHYVNQLSGLCLDVRGGPANYTPVQQWPCNSITNENWYYALGFGATAPTVYSAVANTGVAGGPLLCLDLPGNQPTVGLQVQIFPCNGTAAQRWYTP